MIVFSALTSPIESYKSEFKSCSILYYSLCFSSLTKYLSIQQISGNSKNKYLWSEWYVKLLRSVLDTHVVFALRFTQHSLLSISFQHDISHIYVPYILQHNFIYHVICSSTYPILFTVLMRQSNKWTKANNWI